MFTKFRLRIFLAISLSAILLVTGGCGSDSSSSGGPKTISGVLCDGPIAGATVTLRLIADDSIIAKVTTNDDGTFKIDNIDRHIDLSKCYVQATGGIDSETGIRFTKVKFKAPVELFDSPENIVISPLTTILEETRDADGTLSQDTIKQIADKFAFESDELTLRPDNSEKLQSAAIVLSVFAVYLDLEFTDILDKVSIFFINGTDISIPADIELDDANRAELQSIIEIINANKDESPADLAKAVSMVRLEKIITSYIEKNDSGEKAVFDFSIEPAKTNLQILVNTLHSSAKTIQAEEFAATVEFNNGGLLYSELNVETSQFDPSKFIKTIIRLASASTGSTGLDVGFFSNENPTTGNKRIFLYNSLSGEISLAQNNVILGDSYFVFSGVKTDDGSTEYKDKEYGMFLDPNVKVETRTAEDRNGDTYEYTFYPDNEFKAFDASSPTNTWSLFTSSQFPASVHSQMEDGKAVLDPEYTIFNNITDYENSYVELIAADKMADPNKGELSTDIKRMHIVARLGEKFKTTAEILPGRMLSIIKDNDGKTAKILINFETAAKKGDTPATGENRMRLQTCNADLTGLTEVTGGDGKFYKWGENNNYIYLAKTGSTTIYGLDKSSLALTPVTGMEYPSEFKAFTNVEGGHNAGGRYNFYNMLLENNCLVAEDGTTYLAINYDLGDADGDKTYDLNGETVELTPSYSKIYKHAMIFRVDGLLAEKIFDNGDGVDDDFDTASNEVSKGAVNLISASSDRLFIEIASFDSTGDDVEIYKSSRGGMIFARYASVLEYGYLAVDEMENPASELTHTILQPDPLKYMLYRVAPVTAGNAANGYRLFVSEKIESGHGQASADNLVHIFDFETANQLTGTKGTLSICLRAENENGCTKGSVILYSGEENTIKSYTDGTTLSGDVSRIITDQGIEGPATGGDGEWIGNLPLCGIGNLVLLRLNGPETPMGSSILTAGRTDTENSMEFVYPESPAFWDFK